MAEDDSDAPMSDEDVISSAQEIVDQLPDSLARERPARVGAGPPDDRSRDH